MKQLLSLQSRQNSVRRNRSSKICRMLHTDTTGRSKMVKKKREIRIRLRYSAFASIWQFQC